MRECGDTEDKEDKGEDLYQEFCGIVLDAAIAYLNKSKYLIQKTLVNRGAVGLAPLNYVPWLI